MVSADTKRKLESRKPATPAAYGAIVMRTIGDNPQNRALLAFLPKEAAKKSRFQHYFPSFVS
jgi:hypothetical protein